MKFTKLLKSRKSVRTYTGEKATEEDHQGGRTLSNRHGRI
ncbi:Protein of unknown function [Lactobacillus equicursoris DSM 19284 = JCM 14600 = CIP 110162]|nr:Protein of unknown function [Lactobacillus equicursoris DSM 19284 = JCM 14600 = CIP 110162]